MVNAVQNGEQLPIRGVEYPKKGQERHRDVVKGHVRTNLCACSDEKEDIDVLVEFGQVIDVSQVGGFEAQARDLFLEVEDIVEAEIAQTDREQCVKLIIQTSERSYKTESSIPGNKAS